MNQNWRVRFNFYSFSSHTSLPTQSNIISVNSRNSHPIFISEIQVDPNRFTSLLFDKSQRVQGGRQGWFSKSSYGRLNAATWLAGELSGFIKVRQHFALLIAFIILHNWKILILHMNVVEPFLFIPNCWFCFDDCSRVKTGHPRMT